MYSKQWSPGDTMRVFFPLFRLEDTVDIAVGAVWGHSVGDIKELGLKTAFIPSLTQFDDSGAPIGEPDITYKFSLIAKVFVDSMKEIELAQVAKKQWPSESQRRDAMQQVENKYDSRNNMSAVKPIIGRAHYNIYTEVLCYKLVNGQPQRESASVVSMPLSDSTISKISAILNDPKYMPSVDDQFLEVEWKYPTDTVKASSARSSAINGLTAEYRTINQFPDFEKTLKPQFNLISRDSETIVKRAIRKIDEHKIQQALTHYTFMHSDCLDNAGQESIETLVKHADVIHELDAERAISNQELLSSIKEALASNQATAPVPDNIPDLMANAAPVPDPVPAPIQEPAPTPTPDSLSFGGAAATVNNVNIPDLNAQAPTISNLMNNQNFEPLSDDAIDSIDLGAL